MSQPAAKRTATTPADNPFVEMVRNPAARTYLIIGAGGLLVLSLVYALFLDNVIAAAVVFILGVAGLVARWTISPPALVVAVCYFAFFPEGLPIQLQPGNQVMGRQTNANLLFTDLLVTVAALVHLLATLRFHSILRAGMPFDAPAAFVKPGAKPTVRPAVPVREAELLFVFARVGAVVLAGQLVWLVVTRFKLDFSNGFPLRPFNSSAEETGDPMGGEWIPNSISRFMIAAGIVLGVSFALWLVFWYWRLHAMNRDEARAACLDMEWTTNRRALNQPEKWRGWMKQKLAGTLPKKGFGAWFLVAGLPLLLVTLALVVLGCMGAFR